MTLKTLYSPLGLLATTLWLTGCATDLHAPLASLYPPSGVLHLQLGQTYQAAGVETWHSGARYQALELQLIDATSALKQLQAR